MGGSTQKGNIDLLSPQQSSYLSSALGPQQQQLASGAYSDFLQPYNQEGFQDIFQKSFIDPAQQALQRQIIPGLKESFLGLDESGSGSLNRALAQSATDVSTGLGQQYMNFFQNQQANKLNALQGLGGLVGQRTFEPHIEQTQGIMGPIISALGQIGGGIAMGGPGGGALAALMKALGLGSQQGGQQGGQQQSSTASRTPTGGIGGGGMAFGRYR